MLVNKIYLGKYFLLYETYYKHVILVFCLQCALKDRIYDMGAEGTLNTQ